MNNLGQLEFDLPEIIGLVFFAIVLLLSIPLVTIIINAATAGNIDVSINAIIAVFIPLIFIAAIFEFIRRIFQ